MAIRVFTPQVLAPTGAKLSKSLLRERGRDALPADFDHEPVASVNPTATREDQLADIRQIYPPEREALGVVAIGIDSSTRHARLTPSAR
jgi:hypothetical protein